MNKKISFTIIALSLLAPTLHAAETPFPIDHDIPAMEDELVQIQLLIKATQDNLQKLEKLKASIESFRKAQSACMQKPQNTELLFDMAKKGKVTLDMIEEVKLQDYFRSDFIAELEKMAQVAKKQPIPPAR